MDKPRNLHSNFKQLLKWMAKLKNCKDQVEGRAVQGMDGWLKKVQLRESEVKILGTNLDNFNGGRGSMTPMEMNKNVEKNIRSVENLVNEFSDFPKSVNTSLDKLAKRYSVGEINKFILACLDSKCSDNDGDMYIGKSDGKHLVVKVLPKKHVIDAIFITEVSIIARALHRHVDKLYGFCFSGDMRALVYEYAENGSFNKILYTNEYNLEWEELYTIAIKVAKGIAYLHDDCGVNIILRDVRAHNVLLDKDNSPKVTGFGLAKLLEGDKSHCTLTRARGTPGYAAPEMWLPAAKITAKCDVYSFGIMLFEILGKKENGIGKTCFSNQVWEKFKDGQLDQIIRDCGIVDKDWKKATVLSTLALWCVQMTPEIRPSMNDVVMVLQKQMLVTSPPDPFLFYQSSQYAMCLQASQSIPIVSTPTFHERNKNIDNDYDDFVETNKPKEDNESQISRKRKTVDIDGEECKVVRKSPRLEQKRLNFETSKPDEMVQLGKMNEKGKSSVPGITQSPEKPRTPNQPTSTRSNNIDSTK